MNNFYFFKKLIFLIVFYLCLNILFVYCNKVNGDLFDYVWTADLFEGIIKDESKIFNSKFIFKISNKVEIIESSKDYYVKYNNNYKKVGNEIWIYESNPDLPYYILRNENNKWEILIPAATIGVISLKKIKKEEVKLYIYYYPKIDNLRFRDSPSIDGKFIRTLNKNEKLELINKSKKRTEKINGVSGIWVQVKTEKGEVGWCFDAYLTEWTDEIKKSN